MNTLKRASYPTGGQSERQRPHITIVSGDLYPMAVSLKNIISHKWYNMDAQYQEENFITLFPSQVFLLLQPTFDSF